MDSERDHSSFHSRFDAVPFVICAVLLLAHSSVLFATYLRQDDLNTPMWDMHHLKRLPDLYNSVVELLRPVSMAFIILSDLICYHMQYAWIARLLNILGLCAAALLTYRWQKKFGIDTIFAACFSICVYLTQSAQIISATANYTVMIATIIMAQCACFLFRSGFENRERRKYYYGWGITALLLSLFSYCLATTYVFVFLFIYFMHHREEKWWRRDSFIFQVSFITLASMIGVVLLAKIIFFLFHIIPRDPQRSVAIDWDIPNKIAYWWVMFRQSFNFFDADDFLDFYTHGHYHGSITLIPWIITLLAGIICYEKVAQSGKSTALSIAEFFVPFLIFFSLACITVLPPHYDGRYFAVYAPQSYHEFEFNFRYSLVIMPIALYAVFWSIRSIVLLYGRKPEHACFAKALCSFTVLAALFCAHNLSRYLVGIPEHEMHYMTSIIEREVLPEIHAARPVAVYVVMAENHSLMPHNFGSMEYGLGVAEWSPWWLAGSTAQLMRMLGVESVETEPGYKIMQWSAESVVFQTKWGYIYATKRGVPHLAVPPNVKEAFIDMENVGTYW